MSAKSERTTIRFIGVSNCVPDVGHETACVLINETILIDAGWNAALHMRQFGCDPLAVSHVFVTHCHQDHYLGLAPLIFYRGMAGDERRKREPLVIAGPHIEIGHAVQRALGYLQTDRYPELGVPLDVVRLRPGEVYETERFRMKTAQALHPTLALCYRFEDKLTGTSVVITGDTAYHAPLAQFAAGADVLIHEASAGPVRRDPLLAYGHSGALDAAQLAAEARVKRLYLIHCDESVREASLKAAREVFPQAVLPREGEAVDLPL